MYINIYVCHICYCGVMPDLCHQQKDSPEPHDQGLGAATAAKGAAWQGPKLGVLLVGAHSEVQGMV